MTRLAVFTYLLCWGIVGCGGSREPWGSQTSTAKPEKASSVDAGAQLAPDAAVSLDAAEVNPPATCSGLGADPVVEYNLDFETNPGLRRRNASIGVAVSTKFLSEQAYADRVASEFNLLTPENEMKWNATEPTAGAFNFVEADQLVKFAEQNRMKVRGHTLVWHSQLPEWVNAVTGVESMRSVMARHIERVMIHFRDQFPGRVVAWDVVNEALDVAQDGSVFYRDSPFYRELGAAFVEEAFHIARNVDKQAKLYYNDFGIEGMSPKSTATFEMLRDLRLRGVPIDGVGFQMHTRAEDRGPSLVNLQANLARYAEIGLPVDISEMDASICDTPGVLAERLEQQRLRYNRVAAACLQSGICESIIVWGLHDGSSWINNRDAPCGDGTTGPRPLLFDDKYQRKPSWVGLSDALLGCYY